MFSSAQSKSAARLLTALSVSAVLSAALTVSSCRTNSGGTDTFIPEVPDWSDAAAWHISAPEAPSADILTCRYSDYTRTDHIEAFRPSVGLAEDIFAQGQYGFYCPYYRQISLNVWMDGEAAVEELFPLSMEDISAAFDYYLEHYNNGRPFVLAGFSQGGKAVVELVKHLPAEAYGRMAAAYAIGYRISDEELAQYPQLLPATDSTGTGTIICYNSVACPEAACGVLSPSDVCINPVNWTTDATPAILNDSVTVTVDTVNHLLIVDGLDPEHYYAPSLASTFPLGNYHLQELTLYQEHLRRNTALRLYNFEK